MRKRALLLTALAPVLASAAVLPRYGGELRVALPEAPDELDPALAATPADLAAVRAVHATLVEVDAAGALRPGLLAALPEPEPGDRAFRLRLRPGLRFHDGRPLTAADVASSLARLLAPAARSPHGWIALAIQGADEVLEGRAASLSGVEVLSEAELRVVLDAPFPEFPRALAAAPAAIVPPAGAPSVGAGAFLAADRSDAGLRLLAFPGHHRGRPYADAATLAAPDARRATRAFGRGELDLALRPEPLGPGARDLPPLTAAYALVSERRLGAGAEPLRRALSAVDRAELARLLARGPAAPLAGLLPPALWPSGAAPPAAPPARLPREPRLAILVPSATGALRPIADRLQVKLFDRGARAAVEPVAANAFGARVESGAFDVAVVSHTFVSSSPRLAALEIAWALGGPAAARRALARLGSEDPGAVAAALADELGAVPLFASGLRLSARPELQGLAAAPDGGFDLGEAWLLPARPPP